MMGYYWMLLWGLLVFSGNGLQAQPNETITLANPSFEGAPHDAVTPNHWTSCGFDSSPDILPGPWGVYQKPTHGTSFLGLITREDNTWEALGQKLPKPLRSDRCYKFSIDLALSAAYAGYSRPTRFRIWGAKTPCTRTQLLGISTGIDHYEWKTYEFIFSPKENYPYIIIECYYNTPVLQYYRGNLLLDNISVFEECDRA